MSAADYPIPGFFAHQPRKPGIPGAAPAHRDYLNHSRLFGPGAALPAQGIPQRGVNDELVVRLERNSPATRATLCISTTNGSMNAMAGLDPNSLRELARMCIDAAHDIEVQL